MKWKEKTQGNDYPTIEELLEFLHSRLKILENIRPDRNQKFVSSNNHICKGNHFTQNCETLTKTNINERSDIIRKAKLCFNCLRANHSFDKCAASNGQHHTLLHRENSETIPSSNVTSSSAISGSQTILSTAVILMRDKLNNLQPRTILLDSCSQSNLITKSFATKLGMKLFDIDCIITGVNDTTVKYSHSVETEIKSRINDYQRK